MHRFVAGLSFAAAALALGLVAPPARAYAPPPPPPSIQGQLVVHDDAAMFPHDVVNLARAAIESRRYPCPLVVHVQTVESIPDELQEEAYASLGDPGLWQQFLRRYAAQRAEARGERWDVYVLVVGEPLGVAVLVGPEVQARGLTPEKAEHVRLLVEMGFQTAAAGGGDPYTRTVLQGRALADAAEYVRDQLAVTAPEPPASPEPAPAPSAGKAEPPVVRGPVPSKPGAASPAPSGGTAPWVWVGLGVAGVVVVGMVVVLVRAFAAGRDR
jgi:hypothetical protein